jgi:hypothetical protein
VAALLTADGDTAKFVTWNVRLAASLRVPYKKLNDAAA